MSAFFEFVYGWIIGVVVGVMCICLFAYALNTIFKNIQRIRWAREDRSVVKR